MAVHATPEQYLHSMSTLLLATAIKQFRNLQPAFLSCIPGTPRISNSDHRNSANLQSTHFPPFGLSRRIRQEEQDAPTSKTLNLQPPSPYLKPETLKLKP